VIHSASQRIAGNNVLTLVHFILEIVYNFFETIVTSCCLIIDPATLGQHLGLQTSASETAWNSMKNYDLCQV
jgi:hypothetical protein